MSGIEILDRYIADVEKGRTLDAFDLLRLGLEHIANCVTTDEEPGLCDDCVSVVNGGGFHDDPPLVDLLAMIETALERKP